MNEEIIFDAKSGISIEEQKEILARINAIAEKNKQRLSQNAHAHGGAPDAKPAVVKEAKKKPVFPVAFNAAAALVLAAGTFLLFSFNGKIDIQARSGSAVYNLTEKALIEEIRRETSEKIAAKEMEISL
ncbi:MAG: hypothetical protein FWC03_11910, partial [Treponema sp.]|nr:hypothetical protein [Treponema sp.]